MSRKFSPKELNTLYDVWTKHFHCSEDLLEAGTKVGEFNRDGLEIQVQKDKVSSSQRSGTFPTILKNWHLKVLLDLKLISQYFEGEFEPVTTEDDFLRDISSVWSEFINFWYFGTVYIGYGEDLLEIEKEFLKKNEKFISPEKSKLWSKFRLYQRTQITDDGKVKFASLLSGVQDIDIDPERLLVCSCNQGLNWLYWISLLREYNAGKQKFLSAFKAALKRVAVSVNNQPSFEKEQENMENDSIMWPKYTIGTQGLNNNIYKSFEFFPLEGPERILKDLQAYFELESAWLGLAGRALNNKTERLNLLETQQNQTVITNMQQRNLKNLKNVVLRMKDKWPDVVPDDFEIESTSLEQQQQFPMPGNSFSPSAPGNWSDTPPNPGFGLVKNGQ